MTDIPHVIRQGPKISHLLHCRTLKARNFLLHQDILCKNLDKSSFRAKKFFFSRLELALTTSLHCRATLRALQTPSRSLAQGFPGISSPGNHWGHSHQNWLELNGDCIKTLTLLFPFCARNNHLPQYTGFNLNGTGTCLLLSLMNFRVFLSDKNGWRNILIGFKVGRSTESKWVLLSQEKQDLG